MLPSSHSNQSSRTSNIDHQTNNDATTTTTRSSSSSSSASSSSSSVVGTTAPRPNKSSSSSSFVYLATGARHSIGIAVDGSAYSWGRSNEVGQLGRDTDLIRCKKVGPILMNSNNNTNQNNNVTAVKFVKAYVSQGSTTGAGHSALLDTQGRLWMTGCDRWQQLGLGAAPAGGGTSNGYTWKNGKLWQDRFVLFEQVTDMMRNRNRKRNREDRKDDNNNRVNDEEVQNRSSSHHLIRDVALGGDHTLLLSSNQRDVYAFGKGGDGQLGLVGCPYVSAPIKSKGLSLSSSSKTTSSPMSSSLKNNNNEENTNTNNNTNTSNTNTNNDSMIHAICAIQNCSLTLDVHGHVKDQVGKCRTMEVEKGLQECRSRAIREGLLLANKVVAPATTVNDR